MTDFELAKTIPILEVAEKYSGVSVIKRQRSSAWCMCPFHAEKTPSMKIETDKGLFYCFGCHAGGTVIDWVVRERGVTPAQAAWTICMDFNIMPDRPTDFLTKHKTRDGSRWTENGLEERRIYAMGQEVQKAITRLDNAAVAYLHSLDDFILNTNDLFPNDDDMDDVIYDAIEERERMQNLCARLIDGTLDEQIELLCKYADYIPDWEKTARRNTTEDPA